jgi:AraC-like DNA-binding protein
MCEAYSRLMAGHRVKEVAIDLGYKQVSHFSRDFKSAYGVPPSNISPQREWNHESIVRPLQSSVFAGAKAVSDSDDPETCPP